MTNAEQPANAIHFPGTPHICAEENFLGITKREYFAAMAMQGFIADGRARTFSPDPLGETARKYADGLLRALAAGGEG